MNRRALTCAILLVLLVLVPGCTGRSGDVDSGDLTSGNDGAGAIVLDVWYTFAADSKEEATFLAAVVEFEAANPQITVETTLVPFGNADQLFLVAAQGGEAPDLVRLSSDQLGKIGHVRTDGFPLLEDLRPHITPAQRMQFDPVAVNAMRYDESLYGIPASQDCLSLIFNKALFDAEGLAYPDDSWTTSDMLSAAENLTHGDIHGLALPVKVAYWWFPFQAGWGGSLFDENGTPTLDSNGSAESMEWLMDLEKEHGVVATGTQIESMKSQFIQSEAAMIVDGPWNWATYEASRLDIGQSLLPIVDDTGERLSPLVTYKGWSVSKQSPNKVAATDLAVHLSSPSVQKEFALQTYTMPTANQLASDDEIVNDPVISGFLAQTAVGTPAPTTRGMSLVYDPLSTTIEQVYSDTLPAAEALQAADAQLEEMLATASQASEVPLTPGYRTISVSADVVANTSRFDFVVDSVFHSSVHLSGSENYTTPQPGEGYFDCFIDGEPAPRNQPFEEAVFATDSSLISCNLTAMIPGKLHEIVVNRIGFDGAVSEVVNSSWSTDVQGALPPPPNTLPMLFAVGSIGLSLIALLSYLAWRDKSAGKTRSRLSHLYIAPAMLALALLTFYPVVYGIWLSFTDADQTHLGEQSLVGIANYLDVLMASGFLRVTAFTLVWTITNVVAHVSLGLFLAMVLNNRSLKGRTAYRTALLLPWAIPSYISVLVWRGMLEPAGLLNELLGTDLNPLAMQSSAQISVILVNVWLGVPFMMMSLSGALQALPGDMYEAAEVEGVNSWAQFRHLTLPNLKSAIVPLALLGFIWTFNMFNVIYLMTDGGPDLWQGEPGSTDILITYVYDVAFRDGAYGVAAAWSVIIFVMLVGFSFVYMKSTKATEAVT